MPPETLQIYIAATADGQGFGLTFVRGGDCEADATATHEADAAGMVPLRDAVGALAGATAHTPAQASLFAAAVALERAAATGDGPLVLRFGDRDAAAMVAGTWAPPPNRLRTALDALVRETRRRSGDRVWVAGYDTNRSDFPFGERATGLAWYGRNAGWWGALPPSVADASPRAPDIVPWHDDECSVCVEPYADLWPCHNALARAPPGRWACGHAVCRGCDRVVQGMANDRCPLCRAARVIHMLP